MYSSLTHFQRNFRKTISDPVELHLNEAKQEMWDKILLAFRDALNKAEDMYLAKAQSFNCTEVENTSALSTLRRRAWLALRGKIDEQTTDTALIGKLRVKFEDHFRYDEAGVPRVWKPDDDIDGAFRKAKDEVS